MIITITKCIRGDELFVREYNDVSVLINILV